MLGKLRQCPIALDRVSATLALKAGVWFRRGRLCMVSPDSQATACLPSGRNSTYRPVQISETSSTLDRIHHALYVECREQREREASPTAAIIDSQSVKSAEKGGLVSIRMAMMQARRSKARSATFS